MMFMDLSSPKTWILATVALAGVGGGACALWLRGDSPDGVKVPMELSVASLKKAADEDPGKVMERMRESRNRDDLTDEQRRQVGRNMREVFQTMMRERVDEYFTASEEEKNAVLDRHIEDFQARMQEWETRRKEMEQEQKEKGEDPEKERERWRESMGSRTQQERKEASESRNPDQMARGMAYFMAMQKRATEKGIKLPQWGGPGRGGPGGRGFGGRGP